MLSLRGLVSVTLRREGKFAAGTLVFVTVILFQCYVFFFHLSKSENVSQVRLITHVFFLFFDLR